MTQPTIFRFVFSLVTLLIAGCGGGSSGGSALPQPPTLPPQSNAVAITANNAALVAAAGASTTERTVQLALVAINSVIDLFNEEATQFTRTCGNGGTITITLDDRDNNSSVSAGDHLQIQYGGDCLFEALLAPATGTINVVLSDYEGNSNNSFYAAGSLTTAGNFTVTRTPNESTIYNGGLSFSTISGPSSGSLRVNVAAADSLQITELSNSIRNAERVSFLSLVRSVGTGAAPNFAYVLQISSTIDSQQAGGRLQCRTIDDLTSADIGEPTAGQFDCIGSANSTARIQSDRLGQFSAIDLQVDPEGDGTFESVTGLPNGPANWNHFVDGQLFSPRFRRFVSRPFVPPPSVDPLILSLNVKDWAYSVIRDEIIATTSTAIVKIDPNLAFVTETIDVAGNPGAIGLSDDESTIWVALDDTNQLQRFGYPTIVAGPVFPLGNNASGGRPLDAGLLGVAPGTTDLVVVSTVNPYELMAYNNGARLPNVIAGTRPDNFIFRDGQNIVAIDGGTTALSVFKVSLDSTTGVSVDEMFTGLGDQVRDRPSVGNNAIYLSGGRAINETTVSIEALIDDDSVPGLFYANIVVDRAANRVYALTIGSGLDIYDEGNSSLIGRYTTPFRSTSGRPTYAMVTADRLVTATVDSVDSYALTDLQANFPDEPCSRPLDLSGTLIVGTYIKLECEPTDAIYDVIRDRIYTGLRNVTQGGNSIAIVNPATLAIENYMPVGGKPTSLRLSSDNASLLVVLADTSKVVSIDLDAEMITETTRVGLGSNAYTAVSIAPTTQTGGEFVAAVDRNIALFGNGAVIGDIADVFRVYKQLFVTTDEMSATGFDRGDAGVFSLSTSGVAELFDLSNIAEGDRVEQRGNFMFAADGRRFDMTTFAVDQPCSLPPEMFSARRNAAGPDFSSELVYYASMDQQNVNALSINHLACDPGTQTTGAMQSSPAFKSDDGEVIKTIPVGNGKIAIVTETQIVLLDRPTL